MSRFEWLAPFIEACGSAGVTVSQASATQLAPAQVLEINAGDWGHFAGLAKQQGLRWSGLWAEQLDADFRVNACFAHGGDYLLLRAQVGPEDPSIASHTPSYPAADHPERHARDLFGIRFSDSVDPRRWTRHQAWGEDEFPLRRDFPVAGTRDSEDLTGDPHYPFIQTQGAGVYEIPVGPVHAGIIEPGHFRFQAVGETVLNLEVRLGYVHKGIEKIAEGRDAAGLVRLAARVSGDTCVSHAWAACMAMERAAGLELTPRALALRAILAERERLANHLGDIGAICNDVGFAFAQYQFSRLREDLQRLNCELFGHRLLMDCVIPGGVAVDLDATTGGALLRQHQALLGELDELLPIVDDHPSLEDRLLGTGMLKHDIAELLGTVGYMGKASGIDFDVRRDHGYAPYGDLYLDSSVHVNGDVVSRLKVRADEIGQSLVLLEQLIEGLPQGDTASPWQAPCAGAEGLAMVEGWRGEILCYVRFADQGRIARFFPRDPSWLNWPAIEQLIHGNIVPDFPVCNKSVNGSYSGHDL